MTQGLPQTTRKKQADETKMQVVIVVLVVGFISCSWNSYSRMPRFDKLRNFSVTGCAQ